MELNKDQRVMSEEDTKPQDPNPRLASEGYSVLLDVNDGDRLVFARLSGGAILKIGNKNYSLKPLIGAPFGSLFQVESGEDGSFLSRILPVKQENNSNNVMQDSRDNRELVDNNEAQNLTGEEIEAMRREGAKGDEIIEALIANSKTFDMKTQLSQEKYKLKKQKKYAPKLLLRRPFSRSICEAYFKKYPARIGFLRVDALSLLLTMANVTAYSDVLVVDMVGGLVTGAVAERLGGTGYVCNTYKGSSPYPVEMVRMFNFSDKVLERIVQSSINELSSANTVSPEDNNQQKVCNAENNINETATSYIMVEEITVTAEARVVDNVVPESKIIKAPKAGAKASKETVEMWRENGFSSLIMAAQDQDPWSLVKDVLPLLSYSAPFAIYHQYLQPLATCMHKLQQEKMAINLQITEPWLREYQVLPSRSHPHMQMSSFGGYVLSGIRISTT
ncbi:PREDICTED: tRNA (adenine(58)-N(1))-methyltransferase non-catalytic subunit trm6-like isoform X1 [Camelina sativa]|uniref:tRNA (adenine(58)-N(1))-methyltransferase non-catalytic subunit TRM6 n=1 Tax=Camelina sativa TaxID=90675 RepID=A0ABM0ZND8_CAMSA|nr:PREDICTED: tRNA (adenine(58)-N(1))-methyltransferase non-catalytic subunit trm6-like isoform X1 [Camelina sativa]